MFQIEISVSMVQIGLSTLYNCKTIIFTLMFVVTGSISVFTGFDFHGADRIIGLWYR